MGDAALSLGSDVPVPLGGEEQGGPGRSAAAECVVKRQISGGPLGSWGGGEGVRSIGAGKFVAR